MRHPTQDPKFDIEDNQLVGAAGGETIPPDEPVFLIRAKDCHAAATLRYYRDQCTDPEHIKAIDQRIKDFEAFAKEHPELMKEPDTALSGVDASDAPKSIEPVARPERDEQGQWCHPALAQKLGNREGMEKEEFEQWCYDNGIEVTWITMEDELGMDHPMVEEYFRLNESDFRAWKPEAPEPGWHLLALYDSDDGPVAMWFRHWL